MRHHIVLSWCKIDEQSISMEKQSYKSNEFTGWFLSSPTGFTIQSQLVHQEFVLVCLYFLFLSSSRMIVESLIYCWFQFSHDINIQNYPYYCVHVANRNLLTLSDRLIDFTINSSNSSSGSTKKSINKQTTIKLL